MRISKESEIRKKEIIDTAEKLFNSNGIANTAVSAIVKEINVAQGLFYYYFKSKDDVIDAIVQKHGQSLKQILQQDLSMDCFEKDLDQFVANMIQAFESLCTSLDEDKLGSIVNKSVKQTKQEASLLLQQILRQGIEEDKIKVDDPKIYADVMIGGLYDLIYQGINGTQQIKAIVLKLLTIESED
ncbi:MAG: TetR/AcrR family transcriptional regulator [Erysipelotrichaceae bacterium]|nr:TetR/AcrR family transcriptional regulator [Erysipelotrichaceae bacterium]MDY5252849.1 TetR/AcrR family transcriptional regulator [Erysipelotrichaceae bacterium]